MQTRDENGDLTPEFIAWAESTATRQGLPPTIEDPATLDRLAAIANTRPIPREDVA